MSNNEVNNFGVRYSKFIIRYSNSSFFLLGWRTYDSYRDDFRVLTLTPEAFARRPLPIIPAPKGAWLALKCAKNRLILSKNMQKSAILTEIFIIICLLAVTKTCGKVKKQAEKVKKTGKKSKNRVKSVVEACLKCWFSSWYNFWCTCCTSCTCCVAFAEKQYLTDLQLITLSDLAKKVFHVYRSYRSVSYFRETAGVKLKVLKSNFVVFFTYPNSYRDLRFMTKRQFVIETTLCFQ